MFVSWSLVYSPYTSQNSTANLGACICRFLFKGALIALLWWLSERLGDLSPLPSCPGCQAGRLDGHYVTNCRYWTIGHLFGSLNSLQHNFSHIQYFSSHESCLSLMCLVIFNVTGLLGTIPSVHEIDMRRWVPLTGSLQWTWSILLVIFYFFLNKNIQNPHTTSPYRMQRFKNISTWATIRMPWWVR